MMLSLFAALLTVIAPVRAQDAPVRAQDAPVRAQDAPVDDVDLTTQSSGSGATAWVENLGQWREGIEFVYTRGGLRAWVGDDSLWLERRVLVGEDSGELRSHALRISLEGGALKGARGKSQMSGERSYLFGAESSTWLRGVRGWRELECRDVCKGVDLILRPEEGSFAYDLHLSPGVNADEVVMRVEGAKGLRIERDGSLLMETPMGAMRQRAPVTWELSSKGRRIPVESRFVILDAERFCFAVERVDRGRALVIDPGFEWGTYLGDTDIDRANDVEVLETGFPIVCGITYSLAFPVWPGSFSQSLAGLSDAFVSVFSPDGQHLIYSSFIGGSGDDEAVAVSAASPTEIYVAGSTRSTDFPMVATAYQPLHSGGTDGFVLSLGLDLQTIQKGTFLGSSGEDRIRDLSLGGPGVDVCGSTSSAGFGASAGAWQTSFGGGNGVTGDGFLTRLNLSLDQRVFSTFIGGAQNDVATSLETDVSGAVLVGGSTGSSNFPVSFGALDVTYNGSTDGFLARVDGSGAHADFCTFVGGAGVDVVNAVRAGQSGRPLIGGLTESSNFPVTSGAAGGSYSGLGDAFVAQLSLDGGAYDWSTYLGGDEQDQLFALAYSDELGAIAVGGTRSETFPTTTYAYDRSFNSTPGLGFSDSFLCSFDSSGALDYSSFIGGTVDEEALAVALHGDACVIVGWTNSLNHPTSGSAFDPSYDFSGIPDGYCIRMTLDRYPVLYGAGKPCSAGAVPELYFGGFPSASRGPYEIFIESYMPGEVAYLFHGPSAANLPFAGGSLLVGFPIQRGSLINLDFIGGGAMSWDITPSMIGQTWYFQAWFTDPGDSLGVGLTGGLELTWYP